MARATLIDPGTSTTTVTLNTATCQTKLYFDNTKIPPGAPRPTLPWGYGYQHFDSLLDAYPEVHPEDFVTFGILQEQPQRGTIRDWGEVVTVLAHMIGGRRTLVNELVVIANRIQRLDRNNPMRAVEEQTLIDVLSRKRRRSTVDLSRKRRRFSGGSVLSPARGTRRLTRPSNSTTPDRSPARPASSPSATIVDARTYTWTIRSSGGTRTVPHHPSLGPLGPRGDVATTQDPHQVPRGPGRTMSSPTWLHRPRRSDGRRRRGGGHGRRTGYTSPQHK